MFKRFIVMGIIAALCGMFGCKAQTQDSRSVDVEEFEKVIADTAIVRLDVRTAEEFAAGHIEGTSNIDVLQESFETEALKALPKEKTIALYCRSGRRSKQAAAILSKNGYKVVELATGYLGWTGAGKPVAK